MNQTNHLATFVFAADKDSLEARAQFTRDYPGIVYHEDTDSYEYRGYRFDYFKSGLSFDPTKPDSYLLVDVTNPKNWLFTYGDPEDRWNDYVSAHAYRLKSRETGVFTWLRRLF